MAAVSSDSFCGVPGGLCHHSGDPWRSPDVRHPKAVGVRDRHSPTSVGSLQKSLMQNECCALMSVGEREAFNNSLRFFLSRNTRVNRVKLHS